MAMRSNRSGTAWQNQGRSYRRRSGGPEGLSIYGFNPQPEPPRMLFGADLTTGGAGGIDAAASMVECIAAGGYWSGTNCYGVGEGDDEDETTELDIPTPGTPGAVPVRPENWDLDSEPYATYKIAAGDTFYGLAATYLGTGARWNEIYSTGRNRTIIPNPNDIRTQGPIDMPAEARDRMRAWLKGDRKGKPGDLTDKQVVAANKSKAPYIAAAVLGAVALAGLGYAIYKS